MSKIVSTSKKFLYAAFVLFMLWFVLSYADTLAHNTTDFKYSEWNMFELFGRVRKHI